MLATEATSTPSGHQRATTTPTLATKAERLVTFRRAIASGCSLVDAARAAGVSARTATRWRRDMGTGALSSRDAASAIASKQEAATLLTAIARNGDESAAYRVAAVDKLSKVMGYDAPTETRQVIVYATVTEWQESQRRLLAESAPRKELSAASGNECYVNSQPATQPAPTKALHACTCSHANAQPAAPQESQAGGSPPSGDGDASK